MGMGIELNSHGVNKAIKYHILSDKEMKKIGFRKNYYEGTDHEEYCPYWYFMQRVNFPNEKRWRHMDIEFQVNIPKDGSDLNIMIIDMDFCQHYDYQSILEKNPEHECANIVKRETERWMAYLQDVGVLSGHQYGGYI